VKLNGILECQIFPKTTNKSESCSNTGQSTRVNQHGSINTGQSTRANQHGSINTGQSTRVTQHGSISTGRSINTGQSTHGHRTSYPITTLHPGENFVSIYVHNPWDACNTFSVATQFTVSTGKRANFRKECHWSHAWQRFKRTCVGSNGILECKFQSETAHRTVSSFMHEVPTPIGARNPAVPDLVGDRLGLRLGLVFGLGLGLGVGVGEF
jgi:hypothetical protein